MNILNIIMPLFFLSMISYTISLHVSGGGKITFILGLACIILYNIRDIDEEKEIESKAAI